MGEAAIEANSTYKRSRQRERILELVRQTGSHPTADWIFQQLKAEFPRLSMGTVYRNLQVLMDQGLIKRLTFGSTFDRFEANVDQHYHFVCERCGAIIDLELPVDRSLDEMVARSTPYTVRRHRIEFFGICDACHG